MGRKSPGFTAVAMITLTLGIGANLALFGILNEMLLRPKPVARPHELWSIVPAGGTLGALLAFSWVSRAIMRFASWWPGTPLRLVPDVRYCSLRRRERCW